MISIISPLGSLLITIDLLKLQLANIEYSIPEKIAIEAKLQGVDPAILVEVSRCESNFNNLAVGDHGKARGLFQFWRGTFDTFKEEAGMPQLEYTNENDQIKLAAWAFANQKQSHWTCFSKVVATNAP